VLQRALCRLLGKVAEASIGGGHRLGYGARRAMSDRAAMSMAEEYLFGSSAG